MTTEFMQPKLTGARFTDHSVPLEFLKDLAVLEELLIEVAKWQFLEQNPNRSRTPRGFTDGVQLKLATIDAGSAKILINLAVATGTLFSTGAQSRFEDARDSMIRAISAAENNQPIHAHLPPAALSYFDRFGRSLREGEAIEFPAGQNAPVARLTKETRRRLVLASKIEHLTEATEIRGTIPEADQDNMTFQIQLADGRKISAPMEDRHLDTVFQAFRDYKNRVPVLLQGIGKFNRQDRLLSLESVEHIAMLDALDLQYRLDEFRQLRAGWLDGKGASLPTDGLDWLGHVFIQHFPAELPTPFAYPTEEGGVQLEWSIGTFEVTLEIDLKRRIGEWHSMNMPSGKSSERRLNLAEVDEWTALVGLINDLYEASA